MNERQRSGPEWPSEEHIRGLLEADSQEYGNFVRTLTKRFPRSYNADYISPITTHMENTLKTEIKRPAIASYIKDRLDRTTLAAVFAGTEEDRGMFYPYALRTAYQMLHGAIPPPQELPYVPELRPALFANAHRLYTLTSLNQYRHLIAEHGYNELLGRFIHRAGFRARLVEFIDDVRLSWK